MLSVGLHSPGLLCAAGVGVPRLWSSLLAGGQEAQPWPGLGPMWKGARHTLPVPDPDLSELGVDRRVARTMEKQARMALFAARSAYAGWASVNTRAPESVGLYMGLPTVDEEMPPWEVLEPLRAVPEPGAVANIYLKQTPPFSGLSMLNSSAAAHISAILQLRGTMAAFSATTDAGLQAVIEGALSVQEKENASALVGAVSQKITPLQLLQSERRGDKSVRVGEGAAFLVVSPASEGEPHLLAWVRCFVPKGRRHDGMVDALARLLSRSGLRAGEIDWILVDAQPTPELEQAQRLALEGTFDRPWDELPVFRSETATGVMGPAQPLVHVLLGLHGFSLGRRLRLQDGRCHEEARPMRHVLVCSLAADGQLAAILLEGGRA